MIFVTGPRYAGKKSWVRAQLGLTEAELAACAVWDVQNLASGEDIAALAESLSGRRVVIATEIGCGIVPMDPAERERREAAGRLSCELARRAETVVRVCYGLPQLLKGEWP